MSVFEKVEKIIEDLPRDPEEDWLIKEKVIFKLSCGCRVEFERHVSYGFQQFIGYPWLVLCKKKHRVLEEFPLTNEEIQELEESVYD